MHLSRHVQHRQAVSCRAKDEVLNLYLHDGIALWVPQADLAAALLSRPRRLHGEAVLPALLCTGCCQCVAGLHGTQVLVAQRIAQDAVRVCMLCCQQYVLLPLTSCRSP